VPRRPWELQLSDFPTRRDQPWSLRTSGEAASSRVALWFVPQENPLPRNQLPQPGGLWRNRTRAGLEDKLGDCYGGRRKGKGKGKKEESGETKLCALCSLWVSRSILSAGTVAPRVTFTAAL